MLDQRHSYQKVYKPTMADEVTSAVVFLSCGWYAPEKAAQAACGYCFWHTFPPSKSDISDSSVCR